MPGAARRTLALIRECVAHDRYAMTVHFQERMEQRGLFWPDVLAVIDTPRTMRPEGTDQYHRPKWILSGPAANGDLIEIVCALEIDQAGTEFITLYWND